MIRYNIGCGKRNWPGWYSVDGNREMEHIFHHDISLKYEPDNYIDLLYTSHLIAYLPRMEFASLLKVWYQKIKPGGTLRIATPDAETLLPLYVNRTVSLSQILGPLFGEMVMNGENIYHKVIYDTNTLYQMLMYAGFVNIVSYDHTKTEHANTGNREDQYDDHSASYINGVLISLNIECNKT